MFSAQSFLSKYTILAGNADRILILAKRGLDEFYSPDFLNINVKKILISSLNIDSDEEVMFFEDKNRNLITISVKNYSNSQNVELIVTLILQVHRITGITTLSETDILRAAQLRKFAKCPGQSYSSALAYRDKIIMKKYLYEQNIRVPKYTRAQNLLDIIDFLDANSLPVVVKPSHGQSSEDMYIIKNRDDLVALASKNDYFSKNSLSIDVEEFIDGEMFHVDGLILNEKVVAVWPSRYLTQCGQMKAGKWQASILLSKDNPLTSRLNEYAHKVISCLPNPGNCGFHLEVFYTKENEIIFCEIASRIGGGLISRTWRECFNIDLFYEHLRFQSNIISEQQKFQMSPKILAGDVMYAAKGGTLEYVGNPLKDFDWVYFSDIWKKPGDIIEPAVNLSGTMALIGFKAENEDILVRYANILGQWFEREIRWADENKSVAEADQLQSKRLTWSAPTIHQSGNIQDVATKIETQIRDEIKRKNKLRSNKKCLKYLTIATTASLLLYKMFISKKSDIINVSKSNSLKA